MTYDLLMIDFQQRFAIFGSATFVHPIQGKSMLEVACETGRVNVVKHMMRGGELLNRMQNDYSSDSSSRKWLNHWTLYAFYLKRFNLLACWSMEELTTSN